MAIAFKKFFEKQNIREVKPRPVAKIYVFQLHHFFIGRRNQDTLQEQRIAKYIALKVFKGLDTSKTRLEKGKQKTALLRRLIFSILLPLVKLC